MKKYTHEKAHEEIDYIFKTLLPQRGMAERPEQIRLCHSILDAMLDGSIALCDAGTGIGKTFAYLTAGILHGKCRAAEGKPQRPILISTSSIALQSAIQKEYLPLLSSVLLSEGLISAPIEAVIRKGKAHYACDARLERRVRQVEGSHKNPAARQALHTAWHVLDLDQLSGMSSYDRGRICVPKRCNCRRKDCRYRCFLDACQSGQYTVQICNHNLLLADLIHRSQKKKPLLPDSAAIIIDEAHKLPETARQMFGVTLNAQDFAELIRSLHVERYVLAAELLSEAVEPLAEKLSLPVEEGAGFDAYQMFLERPHQVLTVICRQLEGLLTRETWRLLSAVASTVSLFYLGNPEMIFYAADDDHGGAMLCGTVSELAAQLQATLWRQEQPIVLTSGTLAVGKDFSRFRTAAGLTGERPVTETVCPSPFDYATCRRSPVFRQNCTWEWGQAGRDCIAHAAKGGACPRCRPPAKRETQNTCHKGGRPWQGRAPRKAGCRLLQAGGKNSGPCWEGCGPDGAWGHPCRPERQSSPCGTANGPVPAGGKTGGECGEKGRCQGWKRPAGHLCRRQEPDRRCGCGRICRPCPVGPDLCRRPVNRLPLWYPVRQRAC